MKGARFLKRSMIAVAASLLSFGAANATVYGLSTTTVVESPPPAGVIVTIKPFSDTFTSDTKINRRWTLSEPNPNSTASIGPGGLVLDASGLNGGSDLWPATNYNASLLLQPVTPSLNWFITTQVQFDPTNFFMGTGFILSTQTSGFTGASAFHVFEYAEQPSIQQLESNTNGRLDPVTVPFSQNQVFLGLKKRGSKYSYMYSADGINWTTISVVNDTQPYSYIGLISGRQPYDGQTSVSSNPAFKSFKAKVLP